MTTNLAVRKLALELNTDLANLATYAGNRVMIAALIETAEEKIAIITTHLAEERRTAGIGGCGTIIDMKAA